MDADRTWCRTCSRIDMMKVKVEFKIKLEIYTKGSCKGFAGR